LRSSAFAHRFDRLTRGPDHRSGFGSDAPAIPGLVFRVPSAPATLAGHPRFRLPVPNLVPTGISLYVEGPRPSREFLGSGTFVNVTPTEVSEDEFEAMVADALDSIPDELASQLDNIAVMVQDWPTEAQLGGRSGTLLGLYEGVDLTRRTPTAYNGAMPDRITIFRGPLTARARDIDELRAQVRVTVLHEVGHYFGLSDARLHELGWA